MENSTGKDIFAYEIKKKIFGVDISQKSNYSSFDEVDRKRLLSGVKLSKNEKTGEITIRTNGQSFTAMGLYHLGRNGKTNYFRDKETGKFYLLNNGEVSGPYNDLLRATLDIDKDLSEKGVVFSVTNENNEILEVDSDLKSKPTGNKYINSHIVQNKDGKFAYADAGEPVTGFIFDNATIIKSNSSGSSKVYQDKTTGNLYIVKNYGELVAMLPNFGEVNDFSVNDENLAIVLAEKGSAFLDMESGKVLYQTATPAKSYIKDDTTFVVNFDGGKSIYVEQNSKWVDYKKQTTRSIKELPYEACDVRKGCVQVKNKDGKFGIVDKDGKVLLDFENEYQIISNYNNRTKEFLPIVKDGKMGLFNAETKKIEIQPFCKSLDLSDHYYSGEASKGLYRFLFLDENGKYGIVNNRGHIVIEPVLQTSNSFSGMFSDDYTYMECSFTDKDNRKSRVCVALNNPNIFPTGKETHYSSSKREVEETHTRNRFSDGEVLTGTIVAGQLLGGVGAVGAYSYLSSQKETYKTKRTVKEETKSYSQYNVPASVLPYVHIDTADFPKELQGEAKDFPKPMTIAELKKKTEGLEQVETQKTASKSSEKESEKEEFEERSFE